MASHAIGQDFVTLNRPGFCSDSEGWFAVGMMNQSVEVRGATA